MKKFVDLFPEHKCSGNQKNLHPPFNTLDYDTDEVLSVYDSWYIEIIDGYGIDIVFCPWCGVKLPKP